MPDVCLSLTLVPHACTLSTDMVSVSSVEEAARKLGLDPSHIRRLLARGEIKGRKLGRDWVVLSLDYERKRKPRESKDVMA